MNFMFYLSSVLLGVGLAMDAFTVSIANGMSNQNTGFGTALRIRILSIHNADAGLVPGA